MAIPMLEIIGVLGKLTATFLYQTLLRVPRPRPIDTHIGQNALVANKALSCTKAIHTSRLYNGNMALQHLILTYPTIYSNTLISDQYFLCID